ncbi:MAG: GNAT family N-acetyltransferase [Asgard group archaeon]|nr:GNAT family N-acetyltransferase [Asgard group archaeon]
MSKEMIDKEAKEYGFQVREFQKNQSDAQMLADSFNTWDDPDSWPGGFGHGDVFTAERILEELQKSDYKSKMVAIADGKIVGHCDVLDHFTEKDTCYVGLLGVNPSYQGKKIGKNLLLRANLKAIEMEKDVITLHTWGGNLKAVPLYKKTGYFWSPETSVYMENFIPGILRNEIFKPFFDKFDWYTSYQRTLSLKPDFEFMNKMSVYNYYFVGDEQNSLKVIIDHKAKKICGFELKLDNQTVGCSCLVDNSIGYAGYGKTPIKWIFKNETNEEKQFSLKLKINSGVQLESELAITYIVNAGESRTIENAILLDADIRTEINPHDGHNRTKYQIESQIIFDNQKIDLATGIVPVDPLKVDIVPSIRSIIPGENSTINIRFHNNTTEKLKISLNLQEIKDVLLNPIKSVVVFESKERKDIQITVNPPINYSDNLLSLKFHLYKEDKDGAIRLPDEVIYLPVINALPNKGPKCSGYIQKNKVAIIENETLRLVFRLTRPYHLTQFTDKRDNKTYPLYTNILDLGLPYTDAFGGLSLVEQQVELMQDKESITLVITAASQEKEGVKVRRFYTLSNSSDLIDIRVDVINTSNKLVKNIGLRLLSDSWENIANGGKMFLPLEKGILELENGHYFRSSRHFPNEIEKWSDSWFCCEFENSKLYGVIWDATFMKKIEPITYKLPNFEFYFDSINPGETKEAHFYYYLGRGSWKDFKKLAKSIIHKDSSITIPQEKIVNKIIKEFTIDTESTIFGKQSTFNIQPLNFDDTLKLSIKNNLLKKFKGKIMITLPKGVQFGDNTQSFEEDISELSQEKPYEKLLKLFANEIYYGRIFVFDLRLITEGFTFKYPIMIQILNKDTKVSVKKEDIEGKELITVDNGKINFSVSKDHGGTVTSLKLPSIHSENNLLSSWPKPKPFMWYSDWFGGIGPDISNPYGWNPITYLEKFQSEILSKGLEGGVKITCDLKSKEIYSGIKIEVEYTTLPYSNALKVTFRLINTTNAHLNFEGGVDSYISVAGRVDNSINFLFNDKLITRTFNNSFGFKATQKRWCIFINDEAKMAMAILGPDRENLNLNIMDRGELVNSVESWATETIPPKGKIEYDMLFVLYPINHEFLEILKMF